MSLLKRVTDRIKWWNLRDSYKESLIQKVKGVKSCEDCIFRWWPGGKECKGCDGTPKNWGGNKSDIEEDTSDIALARRILCKVDQGPSSTSA